MTHLPASWVLCTIADVTASVQMIDAGRSKDRDICYVDISSIDNIANRIAEPKRLRLSSAPSRARQIVKSGDVLFATVRPYLRNIAQVPEGLDGEIASTGFAVLRAVDGVVPSYLFYKSISRDFVAALTGEQYGVSYPAVKDDQVRAQPFELPPTTEQRRIVAKIEELFSELDKGVESLTTAREQLKAYRQTVLKHAFEGKLTEDWRAKNSAKLETPEVLLSRVRAEREVRHAAAMDEWQREVEDWRAGGKTGSQPRKPNRAPTLEPPNALDVVDLPAIPKSWAYARMGEFIARIEAGNSFKCDEREPRSGEIGVAKVSAVTWGEYDEAESKTCMDESRVNDTLFIKEGDFLLSRANTIELVGACVIVRTATKPVMLSDKTLRLDFDGGNKWFVLYYLRSVTGRAEIEKRSTGNQESMRNIGQDRIRSIVVPMCSHKEMQVVVSRLDAQLTQISHIEGEIVRGLQQANALRQSILRRAFSGQLVAQDPNEEPASVLLERIRAEKDEVGRARKKTNKNGKKEAA